MDGRLIDRFLLVDDKEKGDRGTCLGPASATRQIQIQNITQNISQNILTKHIHETRFYSMLKSRTTRFDIYTMILMAQSGWISMNVSFSLMLIPM